VTYAPRWHGALCDWEGQLELGWAMQDPICRPVLAPLRELRPSAPVTEFPELGHYPQLEDPDAVAPIVARVAENAV
jgi:pimeloyl-ACP methyl ester carboxylesterase